MTRCSVSLKMVQPSVVDSPFRAGEAVEEGSADDESRAASRVYMRGTSALLVRQTHRQSPCAEWASRVESFATFPVTNPWTM
jgi:hypothetical protein